MPCLVPCYHFKETYKMEVLSENVVGAKTAAEVGAAAGHAACVAYLAYASLGSAHTYCKEGALNYVNPVFLIPKLFCK